MKTVGVFLWCLCFPGASLAQLAPHTEKAIDDMIAARLAASGEPGLSVALAKGGRLVYVKAYGLAQLAPKVPAAAGARYKIGSVTKQFVAASMLLLAEDGKLSLDDKVARYFPALRGAHTVSLRQLLSHTAGYVDYYPSNTMPPAMRKSTRPEEIMHRYGQQPLAFTPGTRWEYSNTNYVIAGRIIEQLSGMSLDRFLRERIGARLHMDSMLDIDHSNWSAADAAGYERSPDGALRLAPSEGKGWTFGAGQLAMTASDLARWDLGLMSGAVLAPASLAALTRPTTLADGSVTRYGLGIGVEVQRGGRVKWSHGGSISGYIARNALYPDERSAIVVLANSGNYPFVAGIADELEALVLGEH